MQSSLFEHGSVTLISEQKSFNKEEQKCFEVYTGSVEKFCAVGPTTSNKDKADRNN